MSVHGTQRRAGAVVRSRACWILSPLVEVATALHNVVERLDEVVTISNASGIGFDGSGLQLGPNVSDLSFE